MNVLFADQPAGQQQMHGQMSRMGSQTGAPAMSGQPGSGHGMQQPQHGSQMMGQPHFQHGGPGGPTPPPNQVNCGLM